MTVRRFPPLFLLAPTLALAACSHAPTGPVHRPAAVSEAAAPDSTASVIAALDQGDEASARRQLKAWLKRAPADPAAHVLLASLDQDPVALLGPKSFAYTVQPGETMIALSERFLGTKLKFYQLARYNHVSPPATLAAGTVLRIPGEAPRAEPPASRASSPRTPEAKPSRPRATTPAATPAVPAAHPAAARQARSLGLAALNQGQVNRAVGLLRRAAALDPGNPLIARDLARAERIARTVQTHR